MTYLNEEMQEKLIIYSKKYNQKYTKCLIREREIPIDGRPEELVRQLFIHFLIKESILLSDKITIRGCLKSFDEVNLITQVASTLNGSSLHK